MIEFFRFGKKKEQINPFETQSEALISHVQSEMPSIYTALTEAADQNDSDVALEKACSPTLAAHITKVFETKQTYIIARLRAFLQEQGVAIENADSGLRIQALPPSADQSIEYPH